MAGSGDAGHTGQYHRAAKGSDLLAQSGHHTCVTKAANITHSIDTSEALQLS